VGRPGQKQHVEIHRKINLRKRLLGEAAPQGTVYLPFCGDGDLAQSLYYDRQLYAADLDPERIKTFLSRFPNSTAVAADCNQWPFPELATEFSVGDFDAYADPWPAFKAFWANAKKTFPFVVFVTDAQCSAIIRAKTFGKKLTTSEARRLHSRYPTETIRRTLEETVAP